MGKTLISEAALGVLATSGFRVVQTYIDGGLVNVDAVAFGSFVSGLVVLVQRHRMKAKESDNG